MGTAIVEKKAAARIRWEQVAVDYGKWLSANPKASKKRRFETFDAICDANAQWQS